MAQKISIKYFNIFHSKNKDTFNFVFYYICLFQFYIPIPVFYDFI